MSNNLTNGIPLERLLYPYLVESNQLAALALGLLRGKGGKYQHLTDRNRVSAYTS